MKKLQQFYILSFQSGYLKRHNYKVSGVSLNEARKNNWVISVAESQLIESVIKLIRKEEFDHNLLDEKWAQRARLKRRKGDNGKDIARLSSEIDEMLYVPQIISVTFEHAAHYKKTSKTGIVIGNTRYVRFMAGAGQLRRKTVIFIDETISDKLTEMFENGIDKSKKINMSKFGAYFGLYGSSGRKVRTPRYVVVKDLEITRLNDTVDFVTEDNRVERKQIDVKLNVFDGMGLVSIDMAQRWREDLGLDYDAVQFLIRSSYIKGLLVAFPFQLLADETNISSITDIYGDVHDIKEVDVILTESQFKMASHYPSIFFHRQKCEENGLYWYVTRVNPEKEKSNFWTSYQYLQVLKDTVDVEELTKDTVQYFADVASLDADKSLIYFTGDNEQEDVDFSRVDNYQLKLLSLNPETINDPYIRQYIIRTLNRKIRDSYTGKIMVKGHYSFMMSDPYALAQHGLGLKVTGLLKEGEYFSEHWNRQGVNKIASGRSPLTWRSELRILNLVENKGTDKWFPHLYGGVVINIFGNDTMLFADGDFDGDLLFTTSNSEIISNAHDGYPVTYEKKPVPKDEFSYSILPGYETKSFGTKIGLVTNYSTTMYAMLPMFPDDSVEHQEIVNRLVVCRKLQGGQIDMTKGLLVGDIPEWGRRKSGDDLHNKLLLKKRPYFMRYLYKYKNKEFEKHERTYDYYCWIKYGISIYDVLDLEYPSADQKKVIEKFYKYSPLIIGSNSVMERLSRFMVERVQEIKLRASKQGFDYTVYMNQDVPRDEKIKRELSSLMREYNKAKKNMYHSDEFENKFQMFEYFKNKAFEISYDLETMTNMAVELCYRDGKNANFVHDIFGDGILNNMMSNTETFRFPVMDKNGDVEFCYEQYSMMSIDLDNGDGVV